MNRAAILFVVALLFLTCFAIFVKKVVIESKKIETVCVPLHINLDESKYIILKTDTIFSTPLDYKRIFYSERKMK